MSLFLSTFRKCLKESKYLLKAILWVLGSIPFLIIYYMNFVVHSTFIMALIAVLITIDIYFIIAIIISIGRIFKYVQQHKVE
jgi:hypothetical protein